MFLHSACWVQVSDPDLMKAEAEQVTVGERCSVEPGDRRGEVM